MIRVQLNPDQVVSILTQTFFLFRLPEHGRIQSQLRHSPEILLGMHSHPGFRSEVALVYSTAFSTTANDASRTFPVNLSSRAARSTSRSRI